MLRSEREVKQSVWESQIEDSSVNSKFNHLNYLNYVFLLAFFRENSRYLFFYFQSNTQQTQCASKLYTYTLKVLTYAILPFYLKVPVDME
jgi:hypothetical protein